MNKLRKISLKRVFAGGSAALIFATALMSLFTTFVTLRPQQASAQASSFEWLNAATIKVGDLIFTDTNPFDGERWFVAAGSTLCTHTGLNRKNIPSDRILVRANNNTGTRFIIDQNDRDNAGQLRCEGKETQLSATNPASANILWYQVGNTIRPVTSTPGIAFESKSKLEMDGSNLEIFIRTGEFNTPCKDIIVHATGGGAWNNGWFIFPMAPEGTSNAEEDPVTIRSEKYEGIFPDDGPGCVRASAEIAKVFKAGDGKSSGCTSPDDTVCGGATLLYPESQYRVVFGDDGYRIVGGVGTETNAPDPNVVLPPEEIKKTVCDQAFTFVDIISLKWIVCPVINMVMSMVEFMETLLTDMLKIDTEPLANDQALHAIWGSMRSIALAIIVITALIMVIFEAAGVEAFSAYTMRTLFTKFGFTVVLIVLSWTLLVEIVHIVNNIVDGARTLVYAPFNAQFGAGNLSTGSSAILLAFGTGAIIALGPWGLATFLVTIGASLGLVVGVITAAHALVDIAIATSPVWLALRVLDTTKGGYELPRKILTGIFIATILAAFAMPFMNAIAQALLHIGGTRNELAAIIIMIIRAFIISAIFMAFVAMFDRIMSPVNGMFSKAQQWAANTRGNQMKNRHEERMSGRGTVFGSEKLAQGYRRVADAGDGGLSFTRRGRAKFNAKKQERLSNIADEMLKKDGGRYSGDDAANALALQKGMTEQKFINQYAADLKKNWKGDVPLTDAQAAQQARDAFYGIQQSYGAKIGSAGMRVAAFKARATSKTGYDPADYNAMGADAASLMHDNLITQADAAAILKSNKERVDQSGIGFTEMFAAMGNAKAQYANGKRATRGADGKVIPGQEIFSEAEVAKLQDDALIGSGPGQLIGGYHKGVSGLAPAMQRRMQKAVDERNAAAAAAHGPGVPTKEAADRLEAADAELQRQMAAFRSRHQLSGQVSEKVQGILSDVGNQEIVMVDGQGNSVKTTVRKYSDLLSNSASSAAVGIDNKVFMDAKYEYDTAGVEDYNRTMQMRAGGGPGAMPNPTAGVGGP